MKKCAVSKLEPHRKVTLVTRNLFFGLSALFAFLCVWFLLINTRELLIPFVILFFAAIVLLGAAIDQNKRLKQFYAVNLQTTHDVNLYKPTVEFIIHATAYSLSHRPKKYAIYAIRLKNSNGKKYLCYLDHDIPYNSITANRLKQKLGRELAVSCYDNTTIINLVENDPYFFRI